jgi:hypothetical protein
MKFFTTISTRLTFFLFLIMLTLAAPTESVAQGSRSAKTGKSSSSRAASKRKTTKAIKKGRSKKSSSVKGVKRKKPSAKGKAGAKTTVKTTAKTSNTAAALPKKVKSAPSPDANTAPRYANNGNVPSDVAYSSARSNPTVSNSTSVSPNEPISMRSVLEKTDQEVLQELFGFDGSNRDTAFMSPYWLGQMRFTIPEQYAKIFPKESVYEEGRNLTIYEMDATQRILPLSGQYEGYVVTAHKDPKYYYLYLYNKAQKRMMNSPQKIASEYESGSMRYKTYSYIFEDAASGKLKMMNCTRSARIDNDTCTVACSADYRVEGMEFNGSSWQTKYVVQQYRTGTKVTSSNVSCGDSSLRSFLEARANAFISYYFRKRE